MSAMLGTLPRRRLIAALPPAAALPAPALLAACGAQPGAAGPATPAALPPDVTLQLSIDLGATYQPLFDGLLNRWRQAHPGGPKVEYTIGGVAQILEKTQAQLAAGTPPDVIQQEAAGAISLIGKGQLLPIDALLRRDKFDLSDYFDRSYPQYEWKGKKHGISKGMSNQSLYVNQTLFEQAGLAAPPVKGSAAGWDFDAFLRTAERLTRRTGGETTQWGFVLGRGLRGGWGQWVRANGAEIFDKDFTRCLLGEARAVEALQLMQDLMYRYRVAPTPGEEAAAGGAGPMFIGQGIVGMRIDPVSNLGNHRQATFQWDLAVNPSGPAGRGRRVTTGGGQAWLIPSASRNQEAAWALVTHATTVEAVKEMSPTWYPARRSALAWLLAQDPQLPPRNRAVGQEGQETMVYDPIFPAYSEIQSSIIVPELAPLWENQRSAAQVAESLVPKVNAALRALG
jgi:multiple sugar transport system substrate-binding protein